MRLRRVFIIVLVLIAVVLGGAVLSGFQLFESAVDEHEQESLEMTAETTATQLDGLLAERMRTVELQAKDPVVVGGDEERRAALDRFVDTTSFQGVSVIDRDGRMVALESDGLSEDEREALIGEDFSDRRYFQEAMTGTGYISEPAEAETGNLIITLSMPIETDGEVVGTLNAALHMGDGAFFETIAPESDTETNLRVDAAGEELFTTGEWGGDDLLEASSETESTGWMVTVARPGGATQQTQLATTLQFIAVAVVLTTLVGFSLWFQRSNLRQIDQLLAGFDRLAERNYGIEIDVGGTEEWGEIGSRFNEVSEALARHERELKQYREIVELVDDPITVQDREGDYQLVNNAVVEVSGCSQEDLLGNDESVFMDEETVSLVEAKKESVLKTEKPVEYEISPQCGSTGRERTFSVRRSPYYNEDGELVGTIAISRDIQNLKEREAQLRQYKRAITGATDLICAVDRDMNYLFANPQYRVYHGIERKDVDDLEASEVLGAEAYDEVTEYVERALAGESVRYRTVRIHPTRGERILDVRYYPLGGESTTGVVAVLRDVTERAERARQLRVVDRVLRHNLRNDLTVIQLEAERITAGAEGPIADAAADILAHTESLLTTSKKSRNITEVLSKPPQQRVVDVTSLLNRVGESFESDHPEATIEIETIDGVEVNATSYLQEAIEELVRNAIIHNDREKPSIGISVEEGTDSITICIADDGPGIPEMDRDVLQTGQAIEDLYHGSGLGLWMVYWVVQRSGGTITVHDAPDRGTEIEVVLPPADE